MSKGGGGGGGGDSTGDSDVRIILGRLNTLRTGAGGVDSAAAAAAVVEAVPMADLGKVDEEDRLPDVAEAPLRITGCCCPFPSAAALRGACFETVEALRFSFFFFPPVAN